MKIIDLKKTLKPFYSAKAKKVTFLEIPEMQYLMVDGIGAPEGPEFQHAVEALYSVAYTLKFMLKKGKMQIDYPVMPLEGLWFTDDPKNWQKTPRNKWQWTAMIMKPDVITQALVNEAKELAQKKKELPSLSKLVLKKLREGKVAQIMHVGPYSTEMETIATLHAAIAAEGLQPIGKHHEIYFGDPRRTAPERLKTILRHGVKKM